MRRMLSTTTTTVTETDLFKLSFHVKDFLDVIEEEVASVLMANWFYYLWTFTKYTVDLVPGYGHL